MIAYFKDKDVMVEVPDDISEGDLADMQKEFSFHSSEALQERSPEELKQIGTISEYKPNFYESYIKPTMQELGIVDYPLVSGKTPGAHAFVGKAIEGYTFGASKPVTDVFEDAYKDHPVYSALGELAGGVGSLLTTGAALRLTQLPKYAAAAGQAATKVAAAGPRFIPPAIMTGSTFGTNTFIRETVKALQEGGVDAADFGATVLKDTTLGVTLGGISGIASARVAIASAGGLGFLSAKIEGADDAEALLNAGIWAIFETVGSFGRDKRLRQQAMGNLSDTIGDYVFARTPKMTREKAREVGRTIVVREAEKVGGVDAIVKSEKEGALQFIESLNQKIRNGKVKVDPAPAASETAPIRIEGPAPASAATEATGAVQVQGFLQNAKKNLADYKAKGELSPEAAEQVQRLEGIIAAGEEAIAAATPKEKPPVPAFKSTNEALEYGRSVAGDESAIESMNDELAKIQPVIDEAMQKGDMQGGMNAAVKKQFLNEAIKEARKPKQPAAEATPAAAAQDIKEGIAESTKPDEKAVKASIVDKLEEALKTAKTDEEVLGMKIPRGETVGKGIRKKSALEDVHIEALKGAPKITFSIPGDGDFTIVNTKEAITDLISRVKKLKTGADAEPGIKTPAQSKAKFKADREFRTTPAGYVTDGTFLAKGAEAPKGAKFDTKKGALEKQALEEIFKAKSAGEAQLVQYETGEAAENFGVSQEPIVSKLSDQANRAVFSTGAEDVFIDQNRLLFFQDNFENLTFEHGTVGRAPVIIVNSDGKRVGVIMAIDTKGGTVKSGGKEVKVEPRARIKTEPTQEQKVKDSVKDEAKSIKDIAKETKILEPNVRRILGVGAKKGKFSRVEKGVYVLNTEDGQSVAYIYAADAVAKLPELAAAGFKANMVFLDIPYNTAAVRGGNRGVKYNLISTQQFKTVVDSIAKILTDENAPIYYMYSQAASGLKQMLEYNNVLIRAGFKPIAEGEYAKTQNDGITQVRNMRGEPIQPEKIMLLNKSGVFDEKEAGRNLNFKLVRPKGYQTEKPASLIHSLILQGTQVGDTVLDPFAGSGVTIAEAIRTGRVGVGIELDPEAVEKFIIPRVEEALNEKAAEPAAEEPEPAGGVYHETYGSSKPRGGRQYGDPGDDTARLIKNLGGLDYIKKLKGPELVKLAKQISGDVPAIKKLMRSLGFFRPGTEEIALNKDIFSDPKLWEAVLAHEIGHMMDYQPGTGKTMARGNILGRIASLREYRKSLLPESPSSTEQILTDKDRRRLRAEAEKIARARAKGETEAAKPDEGPENQFEPQAVLDVWNNATTNVDENLLDFIKRLSTEEKKNIIKSAMLALKKGEKITIDGVKKFNKEAAADPLKVADIYRDLIQKEIKKRRLWENEVITQEFKDLSMYWKPFTPVKGDPYTEYRFSSAELYADFVSVLLNAPQKVKEIAPKGYEAFFNYLEKKPEVMQALIELQTLVQGDDADLQNVRAQDILAMFERGEDAFRERQLSLEAAQKSIWDRLRLIFWDKNSILLDERNKLKKKQAIPPAEDAQYAIEKNSMMGNFVKSYLEDFDQLVYKPGVENGVMDEVKIMLFLDRVGADREELANPLGHTPETAQAVLDNMEKQDPARFKIVSDIATEARKWFRNVSKIPGAADFWTPEQIFTMTLNDKYAPFRVVDYMRDYISAGFASQMGTFKDIGDPLTSLAMKGISVATAIERNRLKKIVGEMLLKSGIQMRPAEVTQIPGVLKIAEPSENYLGTLAWKEGGKWVAYHVDKYIADTFNAAATEKIGMIGGALNTILANSFFRSTFITFNVSFQSVNLFRDFLRTWKTTPGLKFSEALRLYVSSIPEASARAKGDYDPLIQQMERAGALQLTLNSLILGQTSEDRELEAIFQKFDIIESPENKFKGIPIIEQITQLLDLIRYVGDTIETIPKVVGWKALDHMDEEERSYFVRNLVGTPNPRRSGVVGPVMNAAYLFSNIFKEGFRGLIEAGFTNPKSRQGYWTKTFMSSILPKIVMGMASAGFLGIGVKQVMDKVSEYHKTNYVVIPLGIDDQENAIYLTLPQDEDARLISGLFWKMINQDGNLVQNLSDIFSFGAGNFPGPAPLAVTAYAWVEFLSDGNPRDNFRQQDILTEQERVAGGKYAFEPMARWTLNQTGLFRLDVHDRLKDEPIHKTLISSLPILQRFIRVGRQGEREIAQAAGREIKTQEARQNLDVREQAREAVRQGLDKEEFTQNAATADDMTKMARAYDDVKKGFTNDPTVQALNGATSNNQKIAILKKVREGRPSAEFNDYVDALYMNKIISAQVALEARY